MLNPALLRKLEVDQRIDMPTLLSEVINSQGVITAFPLHEYWIDIGRPNELERAEREIMKSSDKS